MGMIEEIMIGSYERMKRMVEMVGEFGCREHAMQQRTDDDDDST